MATGLSPSLLTGSPPEPEPVARFAADCAFVLDYLPREVGIAGAKILKEMVAGLLFNGCGNPSLSKWVVFETLLRIV